VFPVNPTTMSRLQDLPPDLHAALSLVVGQDRDYGSLAAILGIEERAVHDRAHAALAMLAPLQARELSPDQREYVGEYMLGQASPPRRAATRAYLASSAPARAWAHALALELAPLAAHGLPEIPDGPPDGPPDAPGVPAPRDPAPPARDPASPAADPAPRAADPIPPAADPAPPPPTSRRGGAILLGGLAVVAIAAVALIVGLSSGGGSGTPSTPAATGTSTTASSKTGSTSKTDSSGGSGNSGSTATGSSSPGKTHVEATLPLTPPSGSSSKALGLVEVASRSGAHAFLIAAEHLPPTTNFRYAAWLYNTSTHESFLLGRGPTVGSDGKLTAAGGLPENASTYNEIVLTEEQSEKPKSPGTVVLGGAFKL
jgi:hypothetical protein